jgi:DNA-directed RNA polymerase beta' subunit
MTFKGSVYGFQRFGMSKMKDSVLLHSSFERTNDVLFDAALHGKVDQLKGVSESIITGKMIPIGTGLFRCLYDKDKYNKIIREKYENDKKIDDNNNNKLKIDNNNIFDNENEIEFCKNVNFNLIDLIK